MAFEEHEVEEAGPASAAPAIRFNLAKLRGSKAVANVTIPANIAADLAFAAFDMFVVQVGTGTDAGRIRLQKNRSKGTAKLREMTGPRGTYFRLRLGRKLNVPDVSFKAQAVEWKKIDAATIEIVLPPEVTRSSAPSSVAPQRMLAPPIPPARRAVVTSSLMGDPSPQRSALADRRPRDAEDDE